LIESNERLLLAAQVRPALPSTVPTPPAGLVLPSTVPTPPAGLVLPSTVPTPPAGFVRCSASASQYCSTRFGESDLRAGLSPNRLAFQCATGSGSIGSLALIVQARRCADTSQTLDRSGGWRNLCHNGKRWSAPSAPFRMQADTIPPDGAIDGDAWLTQPVVPDHCMHTVCAQDAHRAQPGFCADMVRSQPSRVVILKCTALRCSYAQLQ
jgi:hypothetical protein